MIIYVMALMLFYFLWCTLCDVLITIFYSYSLNKVFYCNFFVMTRNVEIPESYSVKDRAGRRAMDQLLVN
jgi:hypothetical protein